MFNILGEITNFFAQRTHKTLELHFFTQEITSFRNGEPSKHIHRTNRKLVFKKLANTTLGKATVADNLLFTFSFRFSLNTIIVHHQAEMQYLDHPVDLGQFVIDPHEQKIMLTFEMTAPEKEITVRVLHEYKNLMGVKFG